ncbi:MAG: OmpH family outer membrane protein [Cytophagaceae bacterium]|nr:OmpH family outer membrane protein [Cytophagaceae bacterium]
MKTFIIFCGLFFFSALSFGQKFGYINSEVILKKMPEYKKAEQELEQLSLKWQQEIETMKKELEKMQADYQAEEVLLTDEMKKEKQGAIGEKEKALKEYQKKIFGFDGLIFLKRQELMKPIQDKVFNAVEKVAKEKQLQFVFDKSSDLVMIYTNPIHDYTDYVLDKLGLGDKSDTIQK